MKGRKKKRKNKKDENKEETKEGTEERKGKRKEGNRKTGLLKEFMCFSCIIIMQLIDMY